MLYWLWFILRSFCPNLFHYSWRGQKNGQLAFWSPGGIFPDAYIERKENSYLQIYDHNASSLKNDFPYGAANGLQYVGADRIARSIFHDGHLPPAAAVVSKLPTGAEPKTAFYFISGDEKLYFAYGNKKYYIPVIIDDDWFCNDRGSCYVTWKFSSPIYKKQSLNVFAIPVVTGGQGDSGLSADIPCMIRVKRWKWHSPNCVLTVLGYAILFVYPLGQLTILPNDHYFTRGLDVVHMRDLYSFKPDYTIDLIIL